MRFNPLAAVFCGGPTGTGHGAVARPSHVWGSVYAFYPYGASSHRKFRVRNLNFSSPVADGCGHRKRDAQPF
ncbi:hypothetical protein DEDE109153_17090 [Deinococcus deserti]